MIGLHCLGGPGFSSRSVKVEHGRLKEKSLEPGEIKLEPVETMFNICGCLGLFINANQPVEGSKMPCGVLHCTVYRCDETDSARNPNNIPWHSKSGKTW